MDLSDWVVPEKEKEFNKSARSGKSAGLILPDVTARSRPTSPVKHCADTDDQGCSFPPAISGVAELFRHPPQSSMRG
jgi:hypothetical protein